MGSEDRTRGEDGEAVTVRDLEHRFGDRAALSGLTFGVRKGEIVGLLGPNGGGKTTLFRILATLLAPSAGDALVLGRSVRREPAEVRRSLGVVFQRPALDLKLTVEENLRCHGHLHGLSGGDLRRRCREALAALGISDRARDRADRLSGGLQRRAELAKSLLHRPELLLLDEPTTGLDPAARRDFLDALVRLSGRDGVTVLMTTHYVEEAERCARVGILHEGRLAAYGSPHALKAEIGGDVVVLRAKDPGALRERLRSRFGVPAALVDGTVRLERERAHELLARIVEEFREEVSSVSWTRPTLEDVFVHRTGRGFREEPA